MNQSESLVSQLAGAAFRHGATFVGACFVATGTQDGERSSQLAGLAITLASLALSAYGKWRERQKKRAAEAARIAAVDFTP